MKTKLLLILLFGWIGVWGQEKDGYEKSIFSISFKNDTISTHKSSKESYINVSLKVNIVNAEEWKGYELKIEIDQTSSSLPASDYELIDSSFDFAELDDGKIVNLLLKKDTIDDRVRYIVLNLKTFKDTIDIGRRNIGVNKKVVISVKPQEKESVNQIDDYKILSYVGTNFDIVEGKTKAKNLFFATNVFLAPNTVKNRNKVGFYFSLYGNRTMSEIDSTSNVRRTYKLEPLSDSTHMEYTSQNRMITSRVSDNIGVYISPLIRIIKSRNENLHLYYSPSLEFIWRKSITTLEFKDPINIETNTVNTAIPGTILMDDISKRIQNEYTFNFGIAGFFLVHETRDFSFRVHSSVGYSSYFYPSNYLTPDNTNTITRDHDIFFSGRAWITEAKTGLTLQAEVINTTNNPRPFFGITLSKAFKLDKLGTIFNPLTDR